MRVMVTGGRDFTDHQLVWNALEEVTGKVANHGESIWLLHGGATGADSCADRWARGKGFYVISAPIHSKTWKRYGRPAGPRRSQELIKMLEQGDVLVAFPGGTGTAAATRFAKSRRVDIRYYPTNREAEG